MEDFERLFEVRDVALKSLEDARQANLIGHSLDAKLTLKINDEKLFSLLQEYRDVLEEIFIVSQLQLEKGEERIQVLVSKAEGQKCDRCWKYHPLTNSDGRFPNICPRCVSVLEGERE